MQVIGEEARITKRVSANRQKGLRCKCCQAKIAWDRATKFVNGKVVWNKDVMLCTACERAGRKPPKKPIVLPWVDCGEGHNLNKWGKTRKGECRGCRKKQVDSDSRRKRKEETKRERGYVYLYGLKDKLVERGVSAADFGRELRIPTKSMQNYVSVRYPAPPERAKRIAEHLGVSVERIKGE